MLRPSSSLQFIRLAGIILMFAACTKKSDKYAISDHPLQLHYAESFRVTDSGSYKKVVVLNPYKGAQSGYTYLLVKPGAAVPAHDPSITVITVPVKNIVCTSTTHIPLLDYLNLSDRLIGFPNTDYVSSPAMRRRIDAGEVTDLGIDKGMNIERLLTLKPALVMGYAMTGDLGQLKKISELSIPVVINAEYLERHPLGRAEWIKFMALFFNKEKEADSVFEKIEHEYLTAVETAKGAKTRPTVMSGIVYGDTWFLPGGQNYAARLLSDAGADYLWRQDSTSGFLKLSLESVYEKAKDADYWIGVGSFRSLAEIKAAEERYSRFKPFRLKQVYTYNARLGAKGGSEFLELGYLRPDLILRDLVKIVHPDLEPSYQLYFHARLE